MGKKLKFIFFLRSSPHCVSIPPSIPKGNYFNFARVSQEMRLGGQSEIGNARLVANHSENDIRWQLRWGGNTWIGTLVGCLTQFVDGSFIDVMINSCRSARITWRLKVDWQGDFLLCRVWLQRLLYWFQLSFEANNPLFAFNNIYLTKFKVLELFNRIEIALRI